MNEILYFLICLIIITFITLYFQSDDGHGNKSIGDTFTKLYTNIILPIYNGIIGAFTNKQSTEHSVINTIILIIFIILIILFFVYSKKIGNIIKEPFSKYIARPISNILIRLFTPFCPSIVDEDTPMFARSIFMFIFLIFLILIILFYIFYLRNVNFVQTDEYNIALPIIILIFLIGFYLFISSIIYNLRDCSVDNSAFELFMSTLKTTITNMFTNNFVIILMTIASIILIFTLKYFTSGATKSIIQWTLLSLFIVQFIFFIRNIIVYPGGGNALFWSIGDGINMQLLSYTPPFLFLCLILIFIIYFIKFLYTESGNSNVTQNIITNTIIVCIVITTFFLAIQSFTSHSTNAANIIYENKFKYIIYLLLFIISLKMVYTLYTSDETKGYMQNSFGATILAITFIFVFISSMIIYYFKFATPAQIATASAGPTQSFSKLFFIMIGLVFACGVLAMLVKLFTSPTITEIDPIVSEETMKSIYAIFDIPGMGLGIILLIIIFLTGVHMYFNDGLSEWQTYMKYLVMIVGVILAIGFIMLIFSYFGIMSIKSIPLIPNTWVNYFLKFLMICLALGIMYKVIKPYIPTGASSVISLIINIIFYIPCIVVNVIEILAHIKNNTSGSTSKLLLIELAIIFIYFCLPYIISYFSQSSYSGKLLVTNVETGVENVYNLLYPNAAVINVDYIKDMIKILPNHIKYWQLNEISEIATFGQLNNINNTIENKDAKFNYNYALSLWFYIEPGQTTKTYSSLLNYGNKPNILYNSGTNTLSIVVSNVDGPKSCKTSKYGCCDNTDIYKKDEDGTNCHVKSCESSPFGCCAKTDGGIASIYKIDKVGMNCPNAYETCGTTTFGCCSDGITARTDATGTTCAVENECSKSQYGCCIDGITSKNDETGSKCPVPCSNTPFGCCIDGKTSRIDARGTNCNKT